MSNHITVSGATINLFKAIGYRFQSTRWWKTILWIIWFVLAIGFLSAFFESVGEYENRASAMYGIVFLILLGIGAGAAFWKRETVTIKK